MLFRKQQYSYRPRQKRSRLPVIAVLLLVTGGLFAYRQFHQYFLASSDFPETSFTISEGESLASIARRLEEAEIVPSAFWFRLAAKFAGLDDDIRSGTTLLIPGDRTADILGALIYPSGETEVSVTIPEGYTLAQIGATIRAALPHISEEDWQRATDASSALAADRFVKEAQKPADVDLEGYLFPDTYRFYEHATAEDVASRMLRTMESRVNTLGKPTGDAEGMTMHELLTLSSIIEREVRKSDEMREVADIFLKRLEIGMALQSDATVNYVTGGKDPSISLTDRDLDSPYNTYQYPGLPPGPISNPGMNALRAVWNPAENPYYYFLTDMQGKVYYAETHDEHVLNKARYL
jgi:UPF0755 protein